MKLFRRSLGKVAITVEEDYWSRYRCYDKLVIVENENDRLYMSRKPVPPLIDIHNRHYWIPIYVPPRESQGASINIVQVTGNDTTAVMSQDAVTREINRLEELINRYHPAEFNHNININPTRIYRGVNTLVTVQVTTENNAIVDNINIVISKNNVGTINRSKPNTNEFTTAFQTSEACDVIVSITKNGITTSKTVSITERQSIDTLQFYLGLGQSINDITGNPLNSHIVGANNSIVGEYSVAKYGDDEYNCLYLIVPQGAEYSNVVVTYPVDFEQDNDTIINGNTYNVYKTVEIENDNYNVTIE